MAWLLTACHCVTHEIVIPCLVRSSWIMTIRLFHMLLSFWSLTLWIHFSQMEHLHQCLRHSIPDWIDCQIFLFPAMSDYPWIISSHCLPPCCPWILTKSLSLEFSFAISLAGFSLLFNLIICVWEVTIFWGHGGWVYSPSLLAFPQVSANVPPPSLPVSELLYFEYTFNKFMHNFEQ